MKSIAIIGSGGHAKVIIDSIIKMGSFNIVGILDDYKEQGEKALGYDVIGKIEDINSRNYIDEYIIAVGDNYGRYKIFEKLISKEINYATVIHPSAIIANDVIINEGVVIMAGVVINSGTRIKKHAIINTGALIDHDNFIGEFASISPGVVTGGGVMVDDYSAICLGSNLRNGINVFERSVVGMGSVVIEDVFPNLLAFGNPCKKIRHRKFGESYLHQKK